MAAKKLVTKLPTLPAPPQKPLGGAAPASSANPVGVQTQQVQSAIPSTPVPDVSGQPGDAQTQLEWRKPLLSAVGQQASSARRTPFTTPKPWASTSGPFFNPTST